MRHDRTISLFVFLGTQCAVELLSDTNLRVICNNIIKKMTQTLLLPLYLIMEA